MATPDTITTAQLARLIGTPDAPVHGRCSHRDGLRR